VKKPALALGMTAAGVAGGVVLGSKARPRRKVLGIALPRRSPMKQLAKEVGKAGKQLANLQKEAQGARQQAERVGDVLKGSDSSS
jgi:hypothetical protein